MRKLVLRLRARDGRGVSSGRAKVAAEEGLAAYACGALECDCPYRDDERSAAWSEGYRRAEGLDASVW